MSQSIYKRRVTGFFDVEFDDPNNKGKKAKGFHLILTGDSGNKVLDMARKAAALQEGKSADLHIFIFAQRTYNAAGELTQDDAKAWEDLWNNGKGELATQGLYAKEMLIPSAKPFHRFWSRDVGDHKIGDIIADRNGTPITYSKVPITVLCEEDGTPMQDPDSTARRWLTRNEKDGLLKYISEESQTPSTPRALTEDEQTLMELELEAFVENGRQYNDQLTKESVRAAFETKWKEQHHI